MLPKQSKPDKPSRMKSIKASLKSRNPVHMKLHGKSSLGEMGGALKSKLRGNRGPSHFEQSVTVASPTLTPPGSKDRQRLRTLDLSDCHDEKKSPLKRSHSADAMSEYSVTIEPLEIAGGIPSPSDDARWKFKLPLSDCELDVKDTPQQSVPGTVQNQALTDDISRRPKSDSPERPQEPILPDSTASAQCQAQSQHPAWDSDIKSDIVSESYTSRGSLRSPKKASVSPASPARRTSNPSMAPLKTDGVTATHAGPSTSSHNRGETLVPLKPSKKYNSHVPGQAATRPISTQSRAALSSAASRTPTHPASTASARLALSKVPSPSPSLRSAARGAPTDSRTSPTTNNSSNNSAVARSTIPSKTVNSSSASKTAGVVSSSKTVDVVSPSETVNSSSASKTAGVVSSSKTVGVVSPSKTVNSSSASKTAGVVSSSKTVGVVSPSKTVNSSSASKTVGVVSPSKTVNSSTASKTVGVVSPSKTMNSRTASKTMGGVHPSKAVNTSSSSASKTVNSSSSSSASNRSSNNAVTTSGSASMLCKPPAGSVTTRRSSTVAMRAASKPIDTARTVSPPRETGIAARRSSTVVMRAASKPTTMTARTVSPPRQTGIAARRSSTVLLRTNIKETTENAVTPSHQTGLTAATTVRKSSTVALRAKSQEMAYSQSSSQNQAGKKVPTLALGGGVRLQLNANAAGNIIPRVKSHESVGRLSPVANQPKSKSVRVSNPANKRITATAMKSIPSKSPDRLTTTRTVEEGRRSPRRLSAPDSNLGQVMKSLPISVPKGNAASAGSSVRTSQLLTRVLQEKIETLQATTTEVERCWCSQFCDEYPHGTNDTPAHGDGQGAGGLEDLGTQLDRVCAAYSEVVALLKASDISVSSAAEKQKQDAAAAATAVSQAKDSVACSMVARLAALNTLISRLEETMTKLSYSASTDASSSSTVQRMDKVYSLQEAAADDAQPAEVHRPQLSTVDTLQAGRDDGPTAIASQTDWPGKIEELEGKLGHVCTAFSQAVMLLKDRDLAIRSVDALLNQEDADVADVDQPETDQRPATELDCRLEKLQEQFDGLEATTAEVKLCWGSELSASKTCNAQEDTNAEASVGQLKQQRCLETKLNGICAAYSQLVLLCQKRDEAEAQRKAVTTPGDSSLAAEVSSLQVVMDMKTAEVKNLRSKNMELLLKVEKLEEACRQAQQWQAKNEDLKAQLDNTKDRYRCAESEVEALRERTGTLDRTQEQLKREKEQLEWLLQSPEMTPIRPSAHGRSNRLHGDSPGNALATSTPGPATRNVN